MIILSSSVTKNIDLGPERNISINVSINVLVKAKRRKDGNGYRDSKHKELC